MISVDCRDGGQLDPIVLALPQIQVRQANAVIESMRQFRGLFGDEVMGFVLTLVQAEVEWDRQQREAK